MSYIYNILLISNKATTWSSMTSEDYWSSKFFLSVLKHLNPDTEYGYNIPSNIITDLLPQPLVDRLNLVTGLNS